MNVKQYLFKTHIIISISPLRNIQFYESTYFPLFILQLAALLEIFHYSIAQFSPNMPLTIFCIRIAPIHKLRSHASLEHTSMANILISCSIYCYR